MISNFLRLLFNFKSYNPLSRWQLIRKQKVEYSVQIRNEKIKKWEGVFIVEHHLDSSQSRGYFEDYFKNLRSIDSEKKTTDICRNLSVKCSCG